MGFVLVPNTCQIPSTVLRNVNMYVRVLNMTLDNSVVMDLDFMESPDINGFKLPYDHLQTTNVR